MQFETFDKYALYSENLSNKLIIIVLIIIIIMDLFV